MKHQIMGRNRASIALRLHRLFAEVGIDGFECGPDDIPGRPDIVFLEERIAVFVNNCFWHRCPMHFAMPRTSQANWNRKVNQNVLRDRCSQARLYRSGWSVLNIWEHAFDNEALQRREFRRIVKVLERRRNR